MLIVYMTVTGNVRNFIERTGLNSVELTPDNPYFEVNEPYIIVVPSYVGHITEDVIDFVEYKNNIEYLMGFAASGNLNFDDLYCVNGKELSKKFDKPLIFTFEYSGTDKDIEKFKEEISKIEKT
jgi:protein involved in ribonucleotide reduction